MHAFGYGASLPSSLGIHVHMLSWLCHENVQHQTGSVKA